MESQLTSSLTRRRLMRLGTLSVGGIIAASSPAFASSAPAGPGQDGAPAGDPRFRSSMARTPAATTVARSYNGWSVGKTASVIGVRSYTVPGTSVRLTIRSGDVATVLLYLARRFNREVQPLRVGQNWGYDYRVNVNNPKTWSCHASGTAIDLNAVLHPNGAKKTFSAVQIKRLRKILADCNDVIYWGGDFSGVEDDMHFEINVPPGDPRLAALSAWIRGVAPVTPPPPVVKPPPVVTPPPVIPPPPVVIAPGSVIALRAGANNRFVTADIGSTLPLIATATVVGGAEQFQVVPVDATHVALRARANNRFVSADRAGNAPLIANRDQVGIWETFTLAHNSDGTISLRSAVNGRYVTAENRGAQPLVANRATPGPWEKFTVAGF